jgi:ribosomal protein L24E
MNISCAYCNKPHTQGDEAITVSNSEEMYLFCSIRCRDSYGFRKLSNRICAREVCKNRVPEGNRMLCFSCHQKGNHLGEPEVSFDEAERAHLNRMERELHRRIQEKVRIYSSQDMPQEELRSLVPSLQDKAA